MESNRGFLLQEKREGDGEIRLLPNVKGNPAGHRGPKKAGKGEGKCFEKNPGVERNL